MTIENRPLNDRLRNLEECADSAPHGTYERAKSAVEFIHTAADDLRLAANMSGFLAMNDDRIRNVEVALYAYILASNPNDCELIAAEGFGAAMGTPARARVIAGAERDRDALRGRQQVTR